MMDFFAKLLATRERLIVRFAILFACACLVLVGVSLLMWQGLESLQVWREGTALWVVMATLVACLLIEAVAGFFFWRRRPTLENLARRMDQLLPGSRDRFCCALELRKRGGEMGPLDNLVLRQAELASSDPLLWRLPIWSRWPLLLAGASVAILVLVAAGQTRVAGKAYYALRGWPGITVAPGSMEVPSGSDVEIVATVHRWDDGAEIELRGASQADRFAMFDEGDGTFSFTAYGVSETFEYCVVTDALSSDWFRVDVYPPPELKSLEVTIRPPAYTALEPSSYHLAEPRDFEVPEGSYVDFDIVAANVATIAWVNAETTFAEGASFSWQALASATGWLRLTDSRGRRSVTDTFSLKVIPDEPPVVDILEPGEDLSIGLAEKLPLEVYASDDYGLTASVLKVSVAGIERPPVALFDPSRSDIDGVPREVNLLRSITPEALAAENQTLLTYFVEVTDNRKPEAQTTRSDLYFVEIRDPIEAQPLSEEQMAAAEGSEQMQVNLRALILELRRLMRETHALPTSPEHQLKRQAAVTSAGLGTLENELQELFSHLAPMLSVLEGGEFAALFGSAISLLDTAEREVAAMAFDTAMANQQEAYSNLLVVEAFLNAISQQQQMQGGQGSPSPEQGESASGEESEAPLTERLSEARRRVLESAEAQGRLNDAYEALRKPSARESSELYSEQRGLSMDFNEALGEIGDLMQRSNALESNARRASSRMGDAGAAINRRDSETASRQGMRARSEMLELAHQLEQARQALLSEEVRAMAEAAEALSQAQGQLGQQAGGTSPGDAKALGEMQGRQSELRDGLQALAEQARQGAGQLAPDNPELAEGIREALENLEAGRTESAMERAENALRFGSPDRAARLQQGAAEQLGQFGRELREAAGALDGGMGELLSLLQQVEAQRQQLQRQQAGEATQAGEPGQAEGTADASGEGEPTGDTPGQAPGRGSPSQPDRPVSQTAQQLGERIEEAGQRTNSGSLSTVGEALSGSGTAERSVQLLQQASRLLLRELLRQRALEAAQGGGLNAPVPEGYREMVEEYFRSLATESE